MPEPSGHCEPSLVDEVEAFFSGGLAELRAAHDQPLLPWMSLNRLAHADVAELGRIVRGQDAAATDRSASPGHNYAWAVAERALALRVLGGAHGPEEVRRIQRDVLARLELWLIERSQVEPFTIDQVIAEAVEALDASERRQ